jgi:hypothetical protein
MNSDSRDPNVEAFDHVGARETAAPPAAGVLKVQVVRFGPPADARHAEIYAPGSVKAAGPIPVTRAFDARDVIGTAAIDEKGAAVIAFAPGIQAGIIRNVGLGFRVIDSTLDDAGVRTITKLDPICLGVEFAPPLPVVGGVGEQWSEYLTACEITAAPPVQLEELKRAFYAGAQGMYFAVLGAAEGEDEAASDARLEALARELGDYLRLFKSREGIE